MSFVFFLLLCFFSGSIIKITDNIEDIEMKIDRLYAIPCGLAYGYVMGYLMLIDVDASYIFGGIALGCLLAGKIDRPGHYFGLCAIIIVVFLYGVKLSPLVLVIAALAALDEIRNLIHVPESIYFVFEYRIILKLGILILVILEILGPNALAAILAFDIAYILTDKITLRFFHEI